MFKDRHEAGRLLVPPLHHYSNSPDAVVIGLPRGGVVLGYEVAKGLDLPLDVICPRKIGAPFNPELAIGAITETGEGIFHDDLVERLNVPEDYIQATVESEKKIAQQRLKLYRRNRPKIPLESKIVILVDDGLATGGTMRAAIKSVQSEGADKVVVAVPVSPIDTLESIKKEADEVVCLSTPPNFYAVGQFYDHFGQTENEEVVELLHESTSR